ncbi:MAG: chorismate-binding protein, partial [Nitrospira sp.]|nr:chorismate-binding protein [Nitrospira sp.]
MDRQGKTPFDIYCLTASPSQPSFLLDSGKGATGESRYSFIGSDPFSVLTGQQGQACLRTRDGHEETSNNPFDSLCRLFDGPQIGSVPGLPPFQGGAVGYFSYDLVRDFESLPSTAKDDLSIPHVQFGLYDLITAIDHQSSNLQIMFCPPLKRFLGESRETLYREGLERLAEWKAKLCRRPAPRTDIPSLDQMAFVPDQTRESYIKEVGRCQEYIAAGDIYQANLSHRFTLLPPDAYNNSRDRQPYEQEFYRRLQAVNPSPFSGLLHFDEVTLISSSPERLV